METNLDLKNTTLISWTFTVTLESSFELHMKRETRFNRGCPLGSFSLCFLFPQSKPDNGQNALLCKCSYRSWLHNVGEMLCCC